MGKDKFLECGKIINTHGIRGGVKLESWCDTPEDLASLKRIYFQDENGYFPRKVKRASVFKQFVLLELEGVCDVDSAMRLKGCVVFADREELPLAEGSFFVADLIGLPVIDAETGVLIGSLCDVSNLGASDIYTVRTDRGEKMIPAVPEFIKEVDTEKGIFVSLIEGMLD